MNRKTTEQFIKEVEEKFPGKFLLDRVEYVGVMNKIEVGCKAHGYFSIRPNNLLSGRGGCPQCGKISFRKTRSKTTEQFIKEVEEKFPGKYLLDKVKYVNNHTKVEIGCKIHGYWKSKPYDLLSGKGCPVCRYEIIALKRKKTTEQFIKEVEEKFPGKYLLDKVDYLNAKTKVEIGCKAHGYFSIRPNNLLSGKGCPRCKLSKGEDFIANVLDEMSVKYKRQKRFISCRYKNPLPYDFFLPDYNLLIEYDGEQHFIPVKHWGGQKKLKETQRRDWIKTKWAKENNIPLIRFDYLDEEDFIAFRLEQEIITRNK